MTTTTSFSLRLFVSVNKCNAVHCWSCSGRNSEVMCIVRVMKTIWPHFSCWMSDLFCCGRNGSTRGCHTVNSVWCWFQWAAAHGEKQSGGVRTHGQWGGASWSQQHHYHWPIRDSHAAQRSAHRANQLHCTRPEPEWHLCLGRVSLVWAGRSLPLLHFLFKYPNWQQMIDWRLACVEEWSCLWLESSRLIRLTPRLHNLFQDEFDSLAENWI